MDLQVFIASHKAYEPVKKYIDDAYHFIQVGQKNKPQIDGFISDDGNASISDKNANYSELTALYYIWHEVRTSYVGLVHYRRIFSGKKLTLFNYKGLSKHQIADYLKTSDVILPKAVKLRVNIEKNYADNHFVKDLEITKTVISKLYPQYLSAFEDFLGGKRIYLYNMFIMRKDLFDRYAKWLFDILFEVEKQVNLSGYDPYQKRLFGFLAERLFNVWLKKENLKIKEVPVISIELNPFIEFVKDIGRITFGASGAVKK